ncbi:MAG: UDP-N-acetylmuramoyl-L-alanine--D-glutamate ligase [Acidimicrobiales bacterium]
MSTNAEVDLGSPLVVGFGVTGQAVTRALVSRGVTPTVIDDRPSDVARQTAETLGVELIVAPSSDEVAGLVGVASVLLPTPGLPDHHVAVATARAQGLPIRSEFDLARLWDDRPIVTITGTNGKTTVTMLVTEALERSGRHAVAVGNTEVPLVEALDDPTVDVFVVEASSFRLGHTGCFAPAVATWLNLAPDHLDNHGTAEAYEAAKAAIWRDLGPDSVAIGNLDDPAVMRHLPEVNSVTFGLDAGDWRIENGHLVGPAGAVVAVADLVRRQPHDLTNAAAVAATAFAAGAALEHIAATLIDFVGLDHRVQLVGEWDGVAWYNDSKATVPHATLAAVGGFASVVLIAGGRNKGLDMAALAAAVPPVRAVVATGDAAAEIAAVFEPLVEVRQAGSMEEAVAQAGTLASSGDVVLLSPSCTSYDWYANYGERGRDFMRLVKERHDT